MSDQKKVLALQDTALLQLKDTVEKLQRQLQLIEAQLQAAEARIKQLEDDNLQLRFTKLKQ